MQVTHFNQVREKIKNEKYVNLNILLQIKNIKITDYQYITCYFFS